MIETSIDEILSGRLQVSGYRIYAIFGTLDRCLYVGYTKNLQNRMRRHLSDKSEWQVNLGEGEDLRVMIYDHDDVDAVAIAREAGVQPNQFDDESQWAKAAEWYMCDVLRPHINRRKTYKPKINAILELARNGLFTQREAYDEAVQVLRDWNVTDERFDEEEKALRRRLWMDPDVRGIQSPN